MTAPTEYLDWWRQGEEHLGTALGRLTDEELTGPSLLSGWTRAHVLAHLAGNADAMVNLLTWARTGVETPAYSSDEARDAHIAETAALSPLELRAAVLAATQRLAGAVRDLPEHAWAAQVRTRQGHVLPAAELSWLRAREVWVHTVDLDAGIGFADVPDDVLAAVVDDVFRQWDARDAVPDVALFAGDREWGTGALAVAGTLPEVAAWITGRSDGAGLQADGPLPTLAPWA
ncbi:maleylpyruvate isomerase family mycothiol-dependent enzyme [Modestobacter sp. VKM Ac-2986]|uniref:maleylpyruvate isomerase family mycothiol-dependent enzyme n=1 Tax=Modestobacter sp. VKM Ac-2986 TaxID=3004140 RepID=UPI0022AB9834|nr:maleylpyruvate isomerase family mycothiol-dependent enzyme [Modestobacter sp. VKM Ac-2986]MCZ2830720.1 maleylpyruvate isomerase family mycothiol-dependent enzyme [Modestobacter sp. VKM Ac-2986]